MTILFKILAVLNNIACVLALTVNILFYRKPEKKDSSEEMTKERVKFREHWIIMIWWLLGTILIPAFEVNILWIIPWIIVGAFPATFLSRSRNSQYSDPAESAPSDRQKNTSRASKRSKTGKADTRAIKGGDITQNEAIPDQSTRLPDLGKHLALNGAPQKQMMIYPSFTISEIAVVCLGSYCVTKIQEMNGKYYCGTFDFGDEMLGRILAQATERTKDVVIGSLTQDPESIRQIRVPHPINLGIGAVLGSPQQGLNETFIPLVITDVF